MSKPRSRHRDTHAQEVRTQRVLILAITPFLVATLVGLVWLWPSGTPSSTSKAVDLPSGLTNATVLEIADVACPGVEEVEAEAATPECRVARARLTEGPRKGNVVSLELSSGTAVLDVSRGEKIVVAESKEAPAGQEYYFADFQRKLPLAILAAIFAVMVLALARWKGIAALAGFALTMAILILFILPAILSGSNPLLVSVVGSSAIMLVGLYVAHGMNLQTTTALLGTLASLVVTATLALVFVEFGRFSGFTSEEAIFVNVSASQINLRGLLLGGIIIGALGVLDDVTITQASAVWELKKANPAMGAKRLYTSAVRIGRDHIASTVNTLVLAYAGASLPLLILFTIADSKLGDVVNGEIVAEEILRTLVGSIGLVASVPITTALAAMVVSRRRDTGPKGEPEVPISGHSHSHGPGRSDPEDDFWNRR